MPWIQTHPGYCVRIVFSMFGVWGMNGVKRPPFMAAGRKSMPESDLFFVAVFIFIALFL